MSPSTVKVDWLSAICRYFEEVEFVSDTIMVNYELGVVVVELNFETGTEEVVGEEFVPDTGSLSCENVEKEFEVDYGTNLSPFSKESDWVCMDHVGLLGRLEPTQNLIKQRRISLIKE